MIKTFCFCKIFQIQFPPSKFIPPYLLNSEVPQFASISDTSACTEDTEVSNNDIERSQKYKSLAQLSVPYAGLEGASQDWRRVGTVEKYYISICENWRQLDDQPDHRRL